MTDLVIGRTELLHKEMLSSSHLLTANLSDLDVSFCYTDNRIDFINK